MEVNTMLATVVAVAALVSLISLAVKLMIDPLKVEVKLMIDPLKAKVEKLETGQAKLHEKLDKILLESSKQAGR